MSQTCCPNVAYCFKIVGTLSVQTEFLSRFAIEPTDTEVGAYRWSIPLAAVASVWLMCETVIFMLPIIDISSHCRDTQLCPSGTRGLADAHTASWLLSARHWCTGPRVDVDNPESDADSVTIKYWVSDPPRTSFTWLCQTWPKHWALSGVCFAFHTILIDWVSCSTALAWSQCASADSLHI